MTDKQQPEEQPENQKESHEDMNAEQNELERLKEECENYKNGWQRAQADYQNLQREISEKKSEWIAMSEWQVIEEFIPIYDNFKKAFAATRGESTKEQENWVMGISYIMKQFADVLKNHNVEEIKTVGEQFNPNLHEVLAEEVSDAPEGEIVKELDAGYCMKDRVLKVAKVIVSKGQE